MGEQWKIPQDELDRIKREVDLAGLARQRGIELKQHGKDLLGLCPFHDDREPSLVITPSKNLWHCLGACAEGGDVIQWVRKVEGVSFRHAIEILRARDTAVLSDSTQAPVRQNTVPKIAAPFESAKDDKELLNWVVDYYNEQLNDSPEALSYLAKRKIEHPDVLKTFKLGYSNRTICYRLKYRNRAAGSEVRERLIRLGIYRTSGHEHFNGSLVIPVIDEQNNITEMYGRKLRDDLRTGTPKHLYLPGQHHGIFNVQSLAASSEVILCESLIDALTFWCAGWRNVTSSYGIEGFTQEHLEAFQKYQVRKVLIAYDRDDAGDNAASKLSAMLIDKGLEVFRAEFPRGQDANSFACSVSDPADALGSLLRGASWLGKSRPSSPPLAAKEKEQEANEDGVPAQGVTHADEVDTTFDGRAWRIRGVKKNTSYGVLRVSVRVSYGEFFHLDMVDLANARNRAQFIKTAALETGLSENILKTDMRHLLFKLEETQDTMIQEKLKPVDQSVVLTEEEQEEALEFLKSPDLLERIIKDVEQIGVVGETTNILVSYLAAVSRKLDDPLAIIIQSSSAAGKTTLMDAMLSLMPDEDFEKYSAVTGQALFYMSESTLKHKILAIVEEEGAERASYALKLLQSEGMLSIVATGKDAKTGDLKSKTYEVEGPVMLVISTTDIDIDPELQNRCLVLTVDEHREQTQLIHDIQRESQTLEGILKKKDRTSIRRRHQNAQRLLRPIVVANNLATRLTFQDTQIRSRRDHMKYLTMIRTIALLYQYQRPIKQVEHNGQTISYIEVVPSDIERANELAHEVLGRSLDELPPQTRRLLDLIYQMTGKTCVTENMKRSEYRFNRRRVREYTGWSDTALKIHIARLVDLEYLIVHRSTKGLSFTYELVYDGEGENGNKFFMGLIEPEALFHEYDRNRSGQNGDRSGSGQPSVSPRSGGGQGTKIDATPTPCNTSKPLARNSAKTHILGRNKNRSRTSTLSS